jgi:AcrR family transcriptional regulator
MTKDKIALEALAFIDESGLEALSMRKLGSRLGIEAMSLYNHVRNKSDLLDAVHELLLSQLTLASPDQHWSQMAGHIARAFLQLLRAHPNTIPLFAARSATAPGSLQVVDHCIGQLLSAGFSAEESLMLFQVVFCFVIGHATFHYTPRPAETFASAEAYTRYPALARLGGPDRCSPEAEFEFGLHAILAGVASARS